MNPEELAGLLLSDPEHALERGTDALRKNPSGAAEALEGLLEWRDFDVQMWAVELIPKVLGEAGAPLLLKACSHSDPDVRIDALNALARLSPRTARRLIPRLKRQLNEDDPYEPVAALWALARIGDPESLPAVEEVSRSVDRGWHATIAAIVAHVLRDEGDTIAERIRSHDHVALPWLLQAVEIMGTPSLWSAASEFCAEPPDEECAQHCRLMLERQAGSRWRPRRSFRQ